MMVDSKKWLDIQKMYEANKIDVKDMSVEQYKNLEKLYIMQIYNLNNEIDNKQKELEKYKQDILEYRKIFNKI